MSGQRRAITITVITGGSFEMEVSLETSVEELKGEVARRLRVSKEMIQLLHRDRLLSGGVLGDYAIGDEARLSLVPSVETGILTQRPEQSVLEALEGLNEVQVGEFLSGKSPLNLTMRLGDHVMLIQLQLSKGSVGGGSGASSGSGSLADASRALTNTLRRLSAQVAEEGITHGMQHVSNGIYSGTFSGTLSPCLQDGLGKPRKHVSTIVHILNDLLGGVEGGGCKRKAQEEQTPQKRPRTQDEISAEDSRTADKLAKLKEDLRVRREKLLGQK